MGTICMMGATATDWQALSGADRDGFRCHHISTNEVFGGLSVDSSVIMEDTPHRRPLPVYGKGEIVLGQLGVGPIG